MLKRKLFVVVVIFFCIAIQGLAEVKNKDNPSRGIWDFKMEKVWSITSASKYQISSCEGIIVTKNNDLVIHDRKQGRFLIVDQNGKFVKIFGKIGEGPGQVKSVKLGARLYQKDDQIIIFDYRRVHFFDLKGEFLKTTIIKESFTEKIISFIDENKIISADPNLPARPQKEIALKAFDLSKNSSRVLFSVPFKRSKPKPGPRMNIRGKGGLMPGFVFGISKDKIYYGTNNFYNIRVADLQGNQLLSFNLEKKREKIPLEEKKKFMRKPPRMQQKVYHIFLNTIPDYPLYFYKIEAHNNLLYVFCGSKSNIKIKNQKIDIFNLQGKYLHSALINFGKDQSLHRPLSNLVIKGDFIYTFLESDEGDYSVVKYSAVFPR